jgi:putative Ca2+/H+ antiporter (TMEM165/GDT1 family)
MQVFAGALAALAAMTVLSALLGWAAPNLVGVEASGTDQCCDASASCITNTSSP